MIYQTKITNSLVDKMERDNKRQSPDLKRKPSAGIVINLSADGNNQARWNNNRKSIETRKFLSNRSSDTVQLTARANDKPPFITRAVTQSLRSKTTTLLTDSIDPAGLQPTSSNFIISPIRVLESNFLKQSTNCFYSATGICKTQMIPVYNRLVYLFLQDFGSL